jgi:hypothetical protein
VPRSAARRGRRVELGGDAGDVLEDLEVDLSLPRPAVADDVDAGDEIVVGVDVAGDDAGELELRDRRGVRREGDVAGHADRGVVGRAEHGIAAVASSKPPSLIRGARHGSRARHRKSPLTEPEVAHVPPTGATFVSSAPAAWSNSSRALNAVGVAGCGMAEMRPAPRRSAAARGSRCRCRRPRRCSWPGCGPSQRWVPAVDLAQVDLAEVEQAPGALPGRRADVDGGVAGVAAEVALGPLQRDADRPGVGRRDLDAGVDLEAADVREVVAAGGGLGRQDRLPRRRQRGVAHDVGPGAGRAGRTGGDRGAAHRGAALSLVVQGGVGRATSSSATARPTSPRTGPWPAPR